MMESDTLPKSGPVDGLAVVNEDVKEDPGANEEERKQDAELEAEEDEKGAVHVMEGYLRLSVIQWEWVKVLPPWQRNAVYGLVSSDALFSPEHPLRQPGYEGLELYVVTDPEGHKRTYMSLKQVEYLQYYIHEMRLADPVWVLHWAKYKNQAPEEERVVLDDIGPPEYPKGEEWVRIPDVVIHGDQMSHVETIVVRSNNALRKLQLKQKKDNKRLDVGKYVAQRPEDLDPHTAALVDNATPGPGLRRGTDRNRQQNEWRDNDLLEQDRRLEEEVKPGPRPEPWRGTEISAQQREEIEAQLKNMASSAMTAKDEGAAPESASSSTATDPIESSPSNSTITDNFTSQYYSHTQRALCLATLGGLIAAQVPQRRQASNDDDEEKADTENVPPIGRSLFMSIRLTTWEANEQTVLEVGWAAIWWQENTGDLKEGEDRFEEMQDAGHIRVEDHILDKHNGVWKPDERLNYLYGDSIPLGMEKVKTTIEQKIKDLSERAGGGPIYILTHSADKDHSALEKLDLKTTDWYTQFKPPSWEYPMYECVDGIGKTFLIDTAILFAAIEFDPSVRPSPIKTQRSLEEVLWIMYGQDNDKLPVAVGNAGNDAYYLLQLFLHITTSPSLDELRSVFRRFQENPVLPGDEPQEHPSSDHTLVDHDEAHEKIPEEEEDEGDWSEDEMIKGVFITGENGESVQIG